MKTIPQPGRVSPDASGTPSDGVAVTPPRSTGVSRSDGIFSASPSAPASLAKPPAHHSPQTRFSPLARAIQLHSLFWLVAANLVGLLLAAELLWPALGDALAPFTYGRWMPLHLDWQLYGWCSLPLVGALFAWFTPHSFHSSFDLRPSDFSPPLVTGHWSLVIPTRSAQSALWFWSTALALGGVSWLTGETSGKLFLDWHGWARPLLPAAMSALWTVLAALSWWHRSQFSRRGLLARAAFLLLLAAIPSVFYWSTGEKVYPSINPDSGGATGSSLLGSTLGIIAIVGLLPSLLRISTINTRGSVHSVFWIFFVVSCAALAVIDHHHTSHHAAGQITGLTLLLGWIPLTWSYVRRFIWTSATRPWLVAAFAWWTLLVITGLLTFLPGISEKLKFTHSLVAHAHLAMAGLVTSLHVAILNELRPTRPIRTGFVAWQIACALYVTAMLVLGSQEAFRADELFRSELWTQALFTLRFLAGLAMTVVSIRWLAEARRRDPAVAT
ncbi:MAG: hypothetical protein QM760_19125 [Nibricoccus sp.]